MKNIKSAHTRYTLLLLGFLFMMYHSPGIGSNGFSKFEISSFLPDEETFPAREGIRRTNLDTFPSIFKRKKMVVNLQEPKTSALLPIRPNQVSHDCEVIFDGRDPATGNRKKELSWQHLFSFTAPHIKPYLPGKDLLYADSKMFRFNGGYTYLTIKFLWNARSPQTSYGRLRSSGAIRFYLADNKSVTLYNNQESNWVLNKETNVYEMQSLFLLHPRQIKLLRNEPVLKAVVYWERGFEEYPIYPITTFMDQLGCLE